MELLAFTMWMFWLCQLLLLLAPLARAQFFCNCCDDDDDGPTIIQFSAPPMPYPPPMAYAPPYPVPGYPPPPPYPIPTPIGPPLAVPPLFPSMADPFYAPPPFMPPPLFSPPPPPFYSPYPVPGYTCTIIQPDRKKRSTSATATAGSPGQQNPYVEEFKDEYHGFSVEHGQGKPADGVDSRRKDGVEGQAASTVKDYNAEFKDEYGVGKQRLPGPAAGVSDGKMGTQKVGEEEEEEKEKPEPEEPAEKKPADKFAPYSITRRTESG